MYARYFLVIIVFSIVLLCIPYSLLAEAKESFDLGHIEVFRDTWGVPHIFSESDAGAFYGLGYVCAQDRAFQIYWNLRIIQGRTAEIVGDIPLSNRRDRTALWSDRKARTEGFYRAAQRIVPTLDSETIAFLQAYSEGVNAYIKNNRKLLLDLFDRYGLEPESWTPADEAAVEKISIQREVLNH